MNGSYSILALAEGRSERGRIWARRVIRAASFSRTELSAGVEMHFNAVK